MGENEMRAKYKFNDVEGSRFVSFYRANSKTGVVDYSGFYPRSEVEKFVKHLPDLLPGVDHVLTFGGELSRRPNL
jgi:hypothetical protein